MYLIYHVTSHDHLIEMANCEFYGLELLVLCHYAYCNGGDMFLICHVTSHEPMFKGFCEVMGGTPSR